MPRASIESSAGLSETAAGVRLCDHPGCAGAGNYRAPRSRDRLDMFYWFCLDHVRDYNARWNYYAGMSADEIEAEIRNDAVWQRPTWPLGSRIGMRFDTRWRDYGVFGLDDEDAPGEQRDGARKRPLTEQEQAVAVFGLTAPFTFPELKVSVVGNAAVVRHIFLSESELDGKATTTRIGAVQVWQKQDGAWKLLARQGFRLPA